MNRRDLIQTLGFGAAMGALRLSGAESGAAADKYSQATKRLPPLKIEKVRAILTASSKESGVLGSGVWTAGDWSAPWAGRHQPITPPAIISMAMIRQACVAAIQGA